MQSPPSGCDRHERAESGGPHARGQRLPTQQKMCIPMAPEPPIDRTALRPRVREIHDNALHRAEVLVRDATDIALQTNNLPPVDARLRAHRRKDWELPSDAITEWLRRHPASRNRGSKLAVRVGRRCGDAHVGTVDWRREAHGEPNIRHRHECNPPGWAGMLDSK